MAVLVHFNSIKNQSVKLKLNPSISFMRILLFFTIFFFCAFQQLFKFLLFISIVQLIWNFFPAIEGYYPSLYYFLLVNLYGMLLQVVEALYNYGCKYVLKRIRSSRCNAYNYIKLKTVVIIPWIIFLIDGECSTQMSESLFLSNLRNQNIRIIIPHFHIIYIVSFTFFFLLTNVIFKSINKTNEMYVSFN